MRYLTTAVLVLLAVGTCPQPARASGFQIDLHDALGTGRGFAYTAGVRDASAGYYNPAGIAALDSSSVRLSLTYLSGQNEYRPFPGQGPSAETKRLHAFIPSMHAAFDLSDVVDAGVSMFTPFALATEWDNGWAGRYLALENHVTFVFLCPAVSLNVPFVEGLSVAAGPQFVFTFRQPGQGGALQLNRALDFRFLGEPDGELIVQGDSKTLNVGYMLALRYAPAFLDDRVVFGLTWRETPDDHELKGRAKFKGAPPAVGLPNRTNVATEVALPAWLQLGVQVEVLEDLLWVEVDYKWSDWRGLKSIDLDFSNPAAPDTSIHFEWEDVNMVMVGVEAQPVDGLRLRAGYFYDEDPVPSHTLRPELPDEARNGISFGAGLRFGSITLDVAYMKLFFKTATKNNEEGLSSPGGPATANGRYETSVDIFSVSVAAEF